MNYIHVNKEASGNEVRIYYNDYGIGKPVLLIHGWPLNSAMWEYQINDLVNSGHRVITYDRRGFGKSSQPWSGYDYNTLTDDLKALIDHLALEDVTLVGFAMGGGEVVRYFSRHGGKNISKVILISSVTPYMLQSESNPNGIPQENFDGMTKAIQQDRLGFLDNCGKTFFGVSMLHKPLSKTLLNYCRMLGAAASPRATLECIKSFSSTDFRDDMKAVNVPTLIIHGDADKTAPIDLTSKKSAIAIANNTFIVYKGAPHGLFYTHRKKLNDNFITFLNGGDVTENLENEFPDSPWVQQFLIPN
jgi:pimeloyl-ACP methyl ester carboxylesterase